MGDIAGHILHQNFYDSIRIYLENMSESRFEYYTAMSDTVSLLQPATFNEVAVANHVIPQNELLQKHTVLMTSTDMQLVYLAHLAKITKFMPDIASHLGNNFIYEQSETLPRQIPEGYWNGDVYCGQDFDEATQNIKHNQRTQVETIEWDLESLCDYEQVQSAMSRVIMDAYTNIDSLRHLMSPKTLDTARKNDSFSMTTLGGRLSQVEDTPLRIECGYFALHGQILDIYPNSIPVEWESAMKEHTNPTEFISNITPTLLQNIPHAGQTKSKPRLIYQSPR